VGQGTWLAHKKNNGKSWTHQDGKGFKQQWKTGKGVKWMLKAQGTRRKENKIIL
jgi:hypothetical protein